MIEHPDLELSAYLDGDLDAAERARVETHLAACAECRTAVEDLRQLVRRAGALDDRPPARDLWPGIAARMAAVESADVVPIGRAPSRRRFSFTMPQLAAAAVALMTVSAGTAALTLRRPTPAVPSVTQSAALPMLPSTVTMANYDDAISRMEQTLELRRSQLDTATVRVLEQSLRVIDGAIAQARTALARDPYNRYLNAHLQRALDNKLHVLERAATIPVARS